MLLLRARPNTLLLNWRKRSTDSEVGCELCDKGIEDSLHHLLKVLCNGANKVKVPY